jgi:hypothetical protein
MKVRAQGHYDQELILKVKEVKLEGVKALWIHNLEKENKLSRRENNY